MTLSNLHTHTTYCDGKNTPEEMVLAAIERGFSSIGLSGHVYTPFDLRYCMKDTEGYIRDVAQLKKKYKDRIKVFLGVEEDAFAPCDRSQFDYIIGSCHYILLDGKYLPVDSNEEYFTACLEAFDYDVVKLSHSYYGSFCDYISRRKPDIVGHFDLITKFDEKGPGRFLNNRTYLDIAAGYIREALKNDVIFEVNTGAVSRGFRTSPYPHAEMLYEIKKAGGKVTISSDSHIRDTLDCFFEQAKLMLRDIGFDAVYIFDGNGFVKDLL